MASIFDDPGKQAGRIFHRCDATDIFLEAKNSAILSACVKAWQDGVFDWTPAMMTAACYLAMQNVELLKAAMELEKLKIPESVQVGDEIFEYKGPCPLCNQNVDPMKRKRKR